MALAQPDDRGTDELVLGYVPDFRHVLDWQPVFRQQHATATGSIIRRVIWEEAANRRCRLLVDVAECATARGVDARLNAIALDTNVQLVAGPDRLGRGARMYPEHQPRSIYLTRANLLIWLLSCGREYFDLLACADRIVADLNAPAPSEADEDLVLGRERDDPEGRGAIGLNVTSRWERGEWAWLRLTAHGGTLTRANEGTRVWLWPGSGHLDVSVRAWAMEPGRKTYRGVYLRTPPPTPTAD